MKNSKVMLIDIIAYLINDLLGWFIIIWFDLTGYGCKFQNLKLHWVILIIGIIHIVLSFICIFFFFKKRENKYHIKIGSGLFIYNVTMTILPYLYLAFMWFIA